MVFRLINFNLEGGNIPPSELIKLEKRLFMWHYTTKERLEVIIKSGELKASGANKTQSNEKATLWFSKNPFWENTATKLINTPQGIKLMTKQEQYEFCGLGRIKLLNGVKLYNWKQFKEFGGAKIKVLRKLEEQGVRLGANPNDWYWTFDNVKSENWDSIEFWNGSDWESYI